MMHGVWVGGGGVWSGPTEFLREENGYPLAFEGRLTPVTSGAFKVSSRGPQPWGRLLQSINELTDGWCWWWVWSSSSFVLSVPTKGHLWAAPSQSHLQQLMRHVVNHPQVSPSSFLHRCLGERRARRSPVCLIGRASCLLVGVACWLLVQEVRAKGLAARRAMEQHFSPLAVGQVLIQHLTRIAQQKQRQAQEIGERAEL